MRDKNIKLISPETSWACKHGGWPQNFFALCSRLFSHESPQIMWISRLEQSRLARWNVSPRVVSFEVPQQQMHTCVTTSKANIPVILIFFSPSPFPLDDSSQIMHTISSLSKFKWVMIIIISVKMNIQHEICVEATAWKYLNSEPFIQKSTILCFFQIIEEGFKKKSTDKTKIRLMKTKVHSMKTKYHSMKTQFHCKKLFIA